MTQSNARFHRGAGRWSAAIAGLALAVVLGPATGCITYPPGWDAEEQGNDPYESVNRPIFAFNDGLDRYVLDPVAEGWEFITPRFVRTGLDNFFTNLQFPRRLLANLGQAEVVQAGSETGRFLVNTTAGVAGFLDVASWIGMELYDEDFGQMFGRWGIPPGPYWVVPVVGACNPRDGFGGIFDTALDGRNAVTGLGFLATVNERAIADPQIEQARDAALDLYVFVREGYTERRKALVRDEDYRRELGPARPETGDDLYDDELYDDELYDVDGAVGDEAETGEGSPEAPEGGADGVSEGSEAGAVEREDGMEGEGDARE